MATSPSHKFGQIIGNLLEELFEPILQSYCDEKGFYLDKHGPRPKVRSGKKVSWFDKYDNKHDLDFVIEKDGSDSQQGRPIAFIEAAWRRYTKHSRNKSQEIQGAIIPITEKYVWDKPFLGVILAGIFTPPSIEQLKSNGFEVLYIEYQTIIHAFAQIGIRADFDEHTPDNEFQKTISDIESIAPVNWQKVKDNLRKENADKIAFFLKNLEHGLEKIIETVAISPLFGREHQFFSVQDACRFLDIFDHQNIEGDFKGFEIFVRYSNNDFLNGRFKSKTEAIKFLQYVAT